MFRATCSTTSSPPGCFSVLVPTSHGGEGADLVTAMRLYEDLAAADASVAWIVMIGGGVWCRSRQPAPRHLRRCLRGRARRDRRRRLQPGRVDHADRRRLPGHGRWGFASGCEHADWIYGNCVEGLVDGHPVLRAALFTPDDVVIENTWTRHRHVRHRQPPLQGRRTPAFRPIAPSSRSRASPASTSPSPRIHIPAFVSLVVSSVALGIARGALDDILALAGGQGPAARRVAAGDEPAVPTRDRRRRHGAAAPRGACCTRPPRSSGRQRSTVDRPRSRTWPARGRRPRGQRSAPPTSSTPRTGSAAGRPSTPTRRCSAGLRDIHTLTQHFIVRPDTLTTAGAVLAGQEPDVPVF